MVLCLCIFSLMASIALVLAVGTFRNNFMSSYCLAYDMTNAFDMTLVIYLRIVVNFVVPFLSVFVISVITLRNLKKARNTRNTLSIQNNNANERQSTIIVLLATLSFLLFALPEGISPLLMIYEIPIETASILDPCTMMLVLFRSGANLIIYFIVSSRFRKGLFTSWRVLYSSVRDLLTRSNITTNVTSGQ